MAYRFQLRRDTAANWAAVNPVLADGEPGFEHDTEQLKFGDGATQWNDLPYFGGGGTGGSGGAVTFSQLPVGNTSTTVAVGNDSRFSNARVPTGSAGGVLTGTYPNPALATGYGVVVPAFSMGGVIAVGSPAFRWYNDTGRTLTIAKVRAALGTAPTGTSAVFDVLKNGTTIFATAPDRPAITPGQLTDTSGVPSVSAVNDGDYLTVAITSVGSTFAGADLTLSVVMV